MASRAPVPAAPARTIAVPRRDSRAVVSRALARCAARERVLLALLLFERLTPAEAANVLEIPRAAIERAYASLLGDLHARVRRNRAVPAAPERSCSAAPARRAS